MARMHARKYSFLVKHPDTSDLARLAIALPNNRAADLGQEQAAEFKSSNRRQVPTHNCTAMKQKAAGSVYDDASIVQEIVSLPCP